ncbi:hypothetical protein TNCV_4810871 [Trichonephila clavipes]|nr:hypothetical protein TNCV_4810871 [Trichonephila clavipes]
MLIHTEVALQPGKASANSKFHKRDDYSPIVGRLWPDHRDENCRLVDAPCCWPGGSFVSVPLEIVGSSGHEKVPTRGKPGLERPLEDHEERWHRAASTSVDTTVTRSTMRADVGVAIVPQTI